MLWPLNLKLSTLELPSLTNSEKHLQFSNLLLLNLVDKYQKVILQYDAGRGTHSVAVANPLFMPILGHPI